MAQNEMSRDQRDETRADFVVVGAGVAGLTAALRAAEAGLRVVILTKGPAWHPDRAEQATSTFYAQGGIAVVEPGDPTDSVDLHLADTLGAGAGLTDSRIARPILDDGWSAVSGLIGWGAEFDRGPGGDLLRTREGGHSVRRIIHAGGDATGAQVQRALERRLRAASRSLAITGHDDAVATAILRANGQTVGVAYRQRGRERVVHAPTVLLATGGSGHLYAATTNPSGATADGIALALRAGAVVADMEFIQFHPTMLFVEGARGRRTLISEAVRGEGGRLVDVDGDPVTAGVHPMGDLAPRDVVADAVETRIADSGHPCVYLDVRSIADFPTRFPTVTEGVADAGLDVTAGLIPVVPGAHYQCGGVLTDVDGRTAVPGLLAAGEVARTGLHGGNRLASNSLLEGLVMGRRAAAVAVGRRGRRAGEGAAAMPGMHPTMPRKELQDSMSRSVALRRDADGLDRVATALSRIPDRAAITDTDIEDAALTLTATVVVAAARARTESRGCHTRIDHPHTDPQARTRCFGWLDGELTECDGSETITRIHVPVP
ncbi:L-aspartate oxidase [Gordonia hankookensis]|uniref:L-aspartate oxidase n=1 Tax=Gordonia hankookensis TaxID=589403 RepID=A0ABR7WDZ0_9ACTN|nr:L-aspartate oxidase [Gordonia hankookensis]MBD1320022.1 L-aspartate oxidase [Gordonia hankookensis]